MSKHNQEWRSDPIKKQEHLHRVQQFESYATQKVRRNLPCSTPTQLPVAVHFQEINNPDITCLRASVAGENILRQVVRTLWWS